MKFNKKYFWLGLPVLVCGFILSGTYFLYQEKKIGIKEKNISANTKFSFLNKIGNLSLSHKSENFDAPKAGDLNSVKKIEEFSFSKDNNETGKNLATISFGLSHNFETPTEHAKWAVEKEKAFRELEKNPNESIARIVKEYDSLDKYNLHAKASLLIILGRLGNESSYRKLSEIALRDENLPEGYKEIQARESILAITALITHAQKGNGKAKEEFEYVKNKSKGVTREIASVMEKRFFNNLSNQ